MTDSLVAAVAAAAAPGGRPVAAVELVEEAGSRAEDVGGSLLLEGCLAAGHGLLAGGAGHLHCLGRRSHRSLFVAGSLLDVHGSRGGRWLLAAGAVVVTQRLAAEQWTDRAACWRSSRLGQESGESRLETAE